MSKGDGCGGPPMSAFSLSWRELGRGNHKQRGKLLSAGLGGPQVMGMHDTL